MGRVSQRLLSSTRPTPSATSSADGRYLQPCAAADVRAQIAHRVLGAHHDAPPLGRVVLMPHQWDAVLRLDAMLSESGGALLADDAGLGKTYVALAVAARRGGALVIAPASLRTMWEAAASRAQVPIRIVSIESLGRGAAPGGREPLVIVDEAHHARNRNTRRWQALADRCAITPVLLLSATPLHNGAADVAAQLALFLGERARSLAADDLARHVVRRTRGAVRLDHPLPALDGPHWINLPTDDDSLLERILALPPPLPPSDGGRGGALVQWTLVRQWSSSRAAFLGALRRRLAQAVAMRESLARGVLPSRRDLTAWECAEGVMQLAFPELLASGDPAGVDAAALLPAVTAHEAAVAALLRHAARGADSDLARARALLGLRMRHPGARIIAFAERIATIERLWQLVRHAPGVAMLTSHGGEVAGGRIARRELLGRVAAGLPPATGDRSRQSPSVGDPEAVSLLLTTDLLSEGANLQEASVVVHLDLPWSPARMEQRVGRVRRLGSPHLMVTSYAIRPPASAERLLQVERRLREKLRVAGRAIGVAGAIVPGPVVVGAPSPPERWAAVTERLGAWRSLAIEPAGDSTARIPATCVAAMHAGGLALVERRGHPPRLLAVDASGRATDTPAALDLATTVASGPGAAWCDDAARALLSAVHRELHRGRVAGSIGLGGPSHRRLHRALLARIERSLAAAPRHERAALLPLAAASRAAFAAGTSAGVERVLAELLASALTASAWLRALAALAEASRGGAAAIVGPASDDAERVTALVVFTPPAAARAPTAPSAPA